ncbi:hypothetical protein BBJ28_00018945 [Nothophytophthora sp. Chile5]|nr:hypothetical protein BBJ28_00018945 [Nothophytophthora sp. Chile5]
MTSGDEDDAVLEDADAICGWGLDDCDDQLPGRRPAAERAVKTKPRAARAQDGGSSGANLPTLRAKGKHKPTLPPPLPPPAPPRLRKPPPPAAEPAELQSPRTLATFSEEKAEAGRQRRLKAAAATATWKTAAVAIVSASFDLDSDDDHDVLEPETTPRRLPREEEEARHAVVLPRASVAAAATVAVPLLALSLPLLSIVPSCGGNATRLPLQDVQSPVAPLGRRQRSLLAAKDAGATFPLPSGLLKSPRKCRSEPKRGQQGSSAFTTAVRVPLAPRRLPVPSLSGQEARLLPQIHLVGLDGGSSSLESGEDTVESPGSPEAKRSEHDAAAEEEADDESWTRCYDDPELLASSMADLIQALSTFAATTQQAKGRKKRRRRKRKQLQTGPPVLLGTGRSSVGSLETSTDAALSGRR